MDIEGYEFSVIPTIKHVAQQMLFETHIWLDQRGSWKSLQHAEWNTFWNTLQAFGYHVFSYEPNPQCLTCCEFSVRKQSHLTARMFEYSLGNNMWIFLSVAGIAKHNNMVPTFSDTQEFRVLNDTFQLSTLVRNTSAFVFGSNYDTYKGMPVLKGGTRDMRIDRHLQNRKYSMDLPLASVFRFRPNVLARARTIIPSHAVCVHQRYFPQAHINTRFNTCPSIASLRRALRSDAFQHRTLMVFSNDNKRATRDLGSHVDIVVQSGRVATINLGEQMPVGFASRDLAALTICEDLVITCGTFGGFAGALHSGRGRVYHFNDPGIVHAFGTEITSSWITAINF